MSIDAKHPDYRGETWAKIEDVTRERNLEEYLMVLNPNDHSLDNKVRNKQYRERAIFYGLAGQTVRGMVGTIFRKYPSFDPQPMLEYLKENADGAGVSIYQQSQAVCDSVVRKGRAGLAVSFPKTDGVVSQADVRSGRMSATIHRFEPENILNWKTTRDGSRVKLSMVVLREYAEEPKPDDPYVIESVPVIRELSLNEDGYYEEQEWRAGEDKEWYRSGDPVAPLDSAGNRWTEIPFTFVGSRNNGSDVDDPPLLPIVNLNIGHYRNSADYEDSVWFCGQVQPWMSGVNEDHLSLLTKHGQYVGSRTLLAVPSGESFGMEQAEGNPMVRQAMLDKVEQMVSLGARMMTQGSAVKTAEQSRGEREAETSVLALVASNVSEAYARCLGWVAAFMGESDAPEYELEHDFLSLSPDGQMAQTVMMGFLQGSMPLADYVAWMKRAGLFMDDKTVEEYAEELGTPGV